MYIVAQKPGQLYALVITYSKVIPLPRKQLNKLYAFPRTGIK